MNQSDRETLKEACRRFADSAPAPQAEPCRLEAPERNLLAQKILLLPQEDQALLFCRYCFGLDAQGAGASLALAHPHQRLDCCRELLALTLGQHGHRPDDASLAAACQRALPRWVAAALPREEPPPRRGAVLRVVFRRLAVAALIAALTFTTALAVSPELRRRVFEWTINTLPQYSRIGPAAVDAEPTQADFEELARYRPGYVPEGYELNYTAIEFPWANYGYKNKHDEWLYFNGSVMTGNLLNYDTENATIESVIYLEQPAFYWVADGFTYFVWQQDGFQFDIIGNITKDEAMKMAESTKLQK